MTPTPVHCAIVVNSCDRYQEVWDPFFRLFELYWKDCPYPVYLNTESERYEGCGVHTLNLPPELSQRNDVNWSERFRAVLARIDTPYIITLLDDFFLLRKPNEAQIAASLQAMDQRSDIAAIYYKKITGFDRPDPELTGYCEMEGIHTYRFSCQAGLWRKDVLMRILGQTSSPWQFETEGPFSVDLPGARFLSYQNGLSDRLSDREIMPYIWALKSGYGVWQSKWLWNNRRLFKKHGIIFAPKHLPRYYKIQYLYARHITRHIRGLQYRLSSFRSILSAKDRE